MAMKRRLPYCPAFPDAPLRRTFESAADLLIKRAYDCSRQRKFIFGGATEEVISGCPRPVLLFHERP